MPIDLTKLAAAIVALGLSVELLGRRSRGGAITKAEATNAAFVFVKPHACNDAVIALVKKTFAAKGIRITSESDITGTTIDEKSLIDNHYGAIAAKAMTTLPADLNVPAKGQAGFLEMFGESWTEAIAAGKVYNAKQALAKLSTDGAGLDVMWSKLKRGVNLIKFGGGFYCASIDGIYVMNGFYMSMRGGYCKATAKIHTFTVEWDASTLAWEDFRGSVLGGTNPGEAANGSLRKAIYDDWEALGLAALPDTGDNGMHASASPFEGLAERINWCGATLKTDIFGAGLLAAGIAEADIMKWTKDSQQTLRGETGSLFDHLEDQDAAVNIANCRAMK